MSNIERIAMLSRTFHDSGQSSWINSNENAKTHPSTCSFAHPRFSWRPGRVCMHPHAFLVRPAPPPPKKKWDNWWLMQHIYEAIWFYVDVMYCTVYVCFLLHLRTLIYKFVDNDTSQTGETFPSVDAYELAAGRFWAPWGYLTCWMPEWNNADRNTKSFDANIFSEI